MWVQSNIFATSCGVPQSLGYNFSLRRLWITTPDNLVADPGFEGQEQTQFFGIRLPLGPIGPPWTTEGPDSHGIDVGAGLAHSGGHNAWIHPANRQSRAWNAITQVVHVVPHTRYVLTGFVQTSPNLTAGYFGVRDSDGRTVLQETKFGPAGRYTKLTVAFDSGANSQVTLYAGYWAPGADSWLRFDDAALAPA